MLGATFVVMLRAHLKFYVHTRRFFILLPLYLALALAVPALYLTGVIEKPPDVYAFALVSQSNFVNLAVLAAAMLAGDAISQDFSRQGLFTLTQPIGRAQIMLSRALAAFLLAALTMLLWIGIGFAFSEVFYGSVVPNSGVIVAMAVVFVAAVVSFVMLFRSLFKSATVSVIVGVVVVWLVMPILSSNLELVGIEPWFLLSYGSLVVAALSAEAYPPHSQVVNLGPGGPRPTMTMYYPTVPEAAYIMLAYLAASFVITWLVYSRRELKETA